MNPLHDLVRAAGGDPEACGDPMAYMLTVIAERDSLKISVMGAGVSEEILGIAVKMGFLKVIG